MNKWDLTKLKISWKAENMWQKEKTAAFRLKMIFPNSTTNRVLTSQIHKYGSPCEISWSLLLPVVWGKEASFAEPWLRMRDIAGCVTPTPAAPPKQTNQNKNSPDRELLKKVLKIVIKMLKYIDFHKWWVFVWGRGLNNKKSFSYIIIKTIYMQN